MNPDFTLLAFLSGIVGLAITILWLVIAWRAMRAHENLAQSHDALEQHLRKIASSLPAAPSTPPPGKKISETDLSSLPKFSE